MVLPAVKPLVLSLLFIAATSHAAPDLWTVYPRVPRDSENADIPRVEVNGTEVPACSTVMNVGYAHFSLTGKAHVEITTPVPIETFDISPHRRGIKGRAESNTLSFELSKPGDLHIQRNQLPRFFLFADTPENDPPRHGQEEVFDLGTFGMASDPETAQTEAIQKAIDQVSEKKGPCWCHRVSTTRGNCR